jgi:hypothetical protein
MRYILIFVIGYLIVRSFIKFGEEGKTLTDKHKPDEKAKTPSKKISKRIGEYVDYEEIRKEKK